MKTDIHKHNSITVVPLSIASDGFIDHSVLIKKKAANTKTSK